MGAGVRRIHSVEVARQLARRRLPRLAFDFIDGGADDEVTLRANRAAFGSVWMRPEYLAGGHSTPDVRSAFFDQLVDMPVGLAPTGLARLAGPGGDLAGARAAARANTVFVSSTLANHSLEQLARAAPGRVWFQLYVWPDREVVEQLVERACSAEVSALVVTVDTVVLGNRERDVRNGFGFPPRLTARTVLDLARHPRWTAGMLSPPRFANLPGVSDGTGFWAHARYVDDVLRRVRVTPTELGWLRDLWTGPLLVKGILTAADAERALELGADGLIVSNHGGRQLDGAPPALEALAEVAACVGERAPVFMDGGVRRGTDVLKALALGARGCFVGRPWLYGLAAGGEAGVSRVLEVLRAEIERALALTGRASLGEVDASLLDGPLVDGPRVG